MWDSLLSWRELATHRREGQWCQLPQNLSNDQVISPNLTWRIKKEIRDQFNLGMCYANENSVSKDETCQIVSFMSMKTFDGRSETKDGSGGSGER
jgi:hypothetical protein